MTGPRSVASLIESHDNGMINEVPDHLLDDVGA